MKTFIKTALPLLSLVLLTACSDSSSGGSGASSAASPASPQISQNEEIAADGSNVNGMYAAEMWPVNYNLHLKSLGWAGVQRDGDNFEASINLKYAPKSVVLRPAIYTARRCPNINDDINKDAYVDILEARLAMGKIIIPFDSNLDSQMDGQGTYQASGNDGKYYYHQSASFDRLFADLKAPDENPNDQLVKIGSDDGITLPGRIVLVQGLNETVFLPESVATTDGLTAHESIPVACGVLWKVQEMPAELKH